MKQNEANKDEHRGKRGAGRLYKRDGSGKEYSVDSKVHGAFWLEYRVNGKRVRQRLLDESGRSITFRPKAEAARIKILEPLQAKDRVDQLRFVKTKLTEAEEAEALVLDEINPPLDIANAWKAYEQSSERPDSGADTLRRYSGIIVSVFMSDCLFLTKKQLQSKLVNIHLWGLKV
jgi:hypothetical protein